MRIVDIMSEDLVVAALESTTRDDVLGEVVERIRSVETVLDLSHARRVLIERERIGSTGVSPAIAIPHARIPKLPKPVACFARSVGGVDFGALDQEPTHLFLALLAPEREAGLHLKALARASRMFQDGDFKTPLMTAEDRASLWAALRNKDEQLSG